MIRQRNNYKEIYLKQEGRCVFNEFMVDSFKYSTDSKYFLLSHFHTDHTEGLTKKWNHGTIIPTPITIALVRYRMNIPDQYLYELPLNTPTTFEGRNGVTYSITAIDAAHAPGSCCFVIKDLKSGVTHLHVGDFRYDSHLKEDEGWKKYAKNITNLYLDTTYCNPQYDFKERKVVCDEAVDIINKADRARTLFVTGTYTIGKEMFAEYIANKTGMKIHVDEEKYKLMRLCKRDMNLYTLEDSNFEMRSMMKMGLSGLNVLLSVFNGKYDRIISFKPTGWALKTVKRGSFEVCEYSMPYSEHSSFNELVDCVKDINPQRIIPTVPSDKATNEELVELLMKNTRPKPGTLFAFGVKLKPKTPVLTEKPVDVIDVDEDDIKESCTNEYKDDKKEHEAIEID